MALCSSNGAIGDCRRLPGSARGAACAAAVGPLVYHHRRTGTGRLLFLQATGLKKVIACLSKPSSSSVGSISKATGRVGLHSLDTWRSQEATSHRGAPLDISERGCVSPRVGSSIPSPLWGRARVWGRSQSSPTRGEGKDHSHVSPPPRPDQEGHPTGHQFLLDFFVR